MERYLETVWNPIINLLRPRFSEQWCPLMKLSTIRLVAPLDRIVPSCHISWHSTVRKILFFSSLVFIHLFNQCKLMDSYFIVHTINHNDWLFVSLFSSPHVWPGRAPSKWLSRPLDIPPSFPRPSWFPGTVRYSRLILDFCPSFRLRHFSKIRWHPNPQDFT